MYDKKEKKHSQNEFGKKREEKQQKILKFFGALKNSFSAKQINKQENTTIYLVY